MRRRWGAYVAPGLASAGVWIWVPVVVTLALSFTDWNMVSGAPHLVGADNYAKALTDPDNLAAYGVTVLATLALLPLVVALPIPVAVALWKHAGRLTGFYRLLLFFPVIVAPVVAAFMWQWMLNPVGGLLPGLFAAVRLPPPQLLQSGRLALWTIVALTAWKVFGLAVLLYAAGLASVHRDLVEAARVDGAPEGAVTRHIALPALRPTIALVAFIALVHGAQWSFAFTNVLTQGGPGTATSTIFYRLYQLGFQAFDDGQASALAVIVIVVFGGLSVLALRIGRRPMEAV